MTDALKSETEALSDFWYADTFEVRGKSGTSMVDGWESRCGTWRLLKAPGDVRQYVLFLVPLDACFGVFDNHERAAALVEYADSLDDFAKIRRGKTREGANVKAETVQGVVLGYAQTGRQLRAVRAGR